MGLTDSLGRPLRDLRISVTDRCNFRCPYCMPKEVFGREWAFLPRRELLSFEEITRLSRLFAGHGVSKIRITGGEPLLRRDLPRLIAGLVDIKGVREVTLTTNGSLLGRMATGLKSAGLTRLTVSLDALEDGVFRAMNDVDFPVERVLEGISAAVQAGFSPIKINMVVKRGVNEQELPEMARYCRGAGHILRCIEYMDVGHSNGWRLEDVVLAPEILAILGSQWPLEALSPVYLGEVASRYRYRDGGGEIGIIASVTQPFCRTCTRARLTADGQLYTCLFATRGHDLRGVLRGGASDDDIAALLGALWHRRADRYSELRSAETVGLRKVEMSRVGG
ncbi:MAG: GTP 3',8-cyclase MoaA [Gammaproteobacteria bacterium]